ncbi:MAG: helix-turn-helix domain-containing protein [Vallitaleaceae bacterium]|jgi:DNA-binding transcriptional ArsR family regulator|nr:helix-turn-helix domain-containing protein [Vallitaleaceae bacterium]
MKILVENGIVSQRKEGKWTYYDLSLQGTEDAINLLEMLTRRDSNYQASCACDE